MNSLSSILLDKPEKMKQEFRMPHDSFFGRDRMVLSDILRRCEEVYTNHIGAEFRYINDFDKIKWLRKRFEPPDVGVLPKEKKIKLWERLVRTTV